MEHNENENKAAGAPSGLNVGLAAALDEADIAMTTDCCGYLPKNGDEYPVQWNPYNRVVQCHNCGAIWKPKAANLKLRGGLTAEQEKSDERTSDN